MAAKLPSRVYRKHGAYYFVSPANKWIRLGKTLADAYRELAILNADGRDGTIDGLVARYLREVTPKKAPSTQKQDRYRAAQILAVFGAERPENIRPTHIAQYLDRRGNVAANREKAFLSHVYSMAMRWGAVDWNPCRGVHRNPERARDRYPEDWEVEAVGKHLRPAWAVRCVRLAYLVGQRPSDVRLTTRQQVTAEGVYYRQAKTGKKLLVEWSPALSGAARECLEHAGAFLLFARKDGEQERPYTHWALNSAWRRAMAAALKAGDLQEPFQLRDLRPKSGTDAKDKELLGNTDAVRRRHYLNRKAQRVKPTV